MIDESYECPGCREITKREQITLCSKCAKKAASTDNLLIALKAHAKAVDEAIEYLYGPHADTVCMMQVCDVLRRVKQEWAIYLKEWK